MTRRNLRGRDVRMGATFFVIFSIESRDFRDPGQVRLENVHVSSRSANFKLNLIVDCRSKYSQDERVRYVIFISM